jgi:hypothetical protein
MYSAPTRSPEAIPFEKIKAILKSAVGCVSNYAIVSAREIESLGQALAISQARARAL